MMLPDVNVWLAAVWARHVHHEAAKAHLGAAENGLAFCRVTQMALLRLVTNPAVCGKDALTRRLAWELYDRLTASPGIHFLTEPDGLLPIWVAFSKRDDRSHLLWTDDYLAAFAAVSDLELVTLDRALADRYPSVKVICLA